MLLLVAAGRRGRRRATCTAEARKPWWRPRASATLFGRSVDGDRYGEETRSSLGDGRSLPFDRLVLATGSQPIRLPKPGMDLPGVITFRDLADIATHRRRPTAAGAARAVVIGGGLLGIEAAYGLAQGGRAP